MKVFPLSPLILATAVFPVFAQADNLLKNASFEQPKIQGGRVAASSGANPSQIDGETAWGHFQSMDETKKIKVGMTDEVSRTGTQSLFVDFSRAAKVKSAALESDLINVRPNQVYRVSIWGQIDRKRPLTLAMARPLLRLVVEYYQADQETQTGDTEYRTQQIPGSPKRMLFMPGKWNEYFSRVKTPEDAAFMKISFVFEASSAAGEADGVLFLDDAVVDVPEGEENPLADEADATAKPDAPKQVFPVVPAQAPK